MTLPRCSYPGTIRQYLQPRATQRVAYGSCQWLKHQKSTKSTKSNQRAPKEHQARPRVAAAPAVVKKASHSISLRHQVVISSSANSTPPTGDLRGAATRMPQR